MKKIIKWAVVSSAAMLLSPLAFAQTAQTTTTPGTTTTVVTTPAPAKVTPVPGTTTVVIQKTVKPGFTVCYLPTPRHIEGSRIVQRCGPYGVCREFRVTREFDVTAYADCHLEKYACTRGYRSFGWYPNKQDALSAVSRCHHTISGNVPGEWRITY